MKKIITIIIYLFAAIGFVLVSGFFAVKYGITNEQGIIDNQRNTYTEDIQKKDIMVSISQEKKQVGTWQQTKEWETLKTAIVRDEKQIKQAADTLAIEPRMIVAIIMVEQMRLFTDDRELFKKVFAPLKILGVQSQFSWGVAGIKRETAITAENNLKNPSSPFYIGKGYENILSFATNDIEQERFSRLTDQHKRYYSYLYTATIIKQLERQWENTGYHIHTRADILATLFNIGFNKSHPNASPKSGGASITINDTSYSFGALAGEFYQSEELIEFFPRNAKN